MADIKLDLSRIASVPLEENYLAAVLRYLADSTLDIRANLRFEIAGRDQISESLLKVAEQLKREAGAVRNLSSGMDQISCAYRSTENRCGRSLILASNHGISD